MKSSLIIFLTVITSFIVSQDITGQSDFEWNGYIQTRLNSDFNTHNEFMIRRGKLWVKGVVPSIDHLSFKVQTVFRSHKDYSFMVQDVYAQYSAGEHQFTIGRMVPDFTLQWNQPDAVIPTLERGLVADGLIHGDQSIARLIGFQYRYNQSDDFHLGTGIFNANFNIPGENSDRSFLYLFRSSYNFIHSAKMLLHLGFSASYRKLNSISLPRIYNTDKIISGDDFRWGFESLFSTNWLELEGEYLTANINKDHAWGYYVY